MQEKIKVWRKEYKACLTAVEIRDLEKTEKDVVSCKCWNCRGCLYVVVCYINYILPLGVSIIADILKKKLLIINTFTS